ncbi:MAG: hypothetical protein E6767_09810 [Dysgonomonas sp.]|nr:hypothetical protein [Dysgonomonas sp.]
MKKLCIFIFLNRKILIAMLIGGILGYFHWFFWGCYWGTYPMSAVWWVNCCYGGLFFGLFASLKGSRFQIW